MEVMMWVLLIAIICLLIYAYSIVYQHSNKSGKMAAGHDQAIEKAITKNNENPHFYYRSYPHILDEARRELANVGWLTRIFNYIYSDLNHMRERLGAYNRLFYDTSWCDIKQLTDHIRFVRKDVEHVVQHMELQRAEYLELIQLEVIDSVQDLVRKHKHLIEILRDLDYGKYVLMADPLEIQATVANVQAGKLLLDSLREIREGDVEAKAKRLKEIEEKGQRLLQDATESERPMYEALIETEKQKVLES